VRLLPVGLLAPLLRAGHGPQNKAFGTGPGERGRQCLASPGLAQAQTLEVCNG